MTAHIAPDMIEFKGTNQCGVNGTLFPSGARTNLMQCVDNVYEHHEPLVKGSA